MNVSIPTISLNHYLCINSLNLPEICPKQRFHHTSAPATVCYGRIFGFKLTDFMMQPNNRVMLSQLIFI